MRFSFRSEIWPIAGAFRISRGAKTEAQVIVVEVERDGAIGRGEAVPYRRFGESIDGALAMLEDMRPRVEAGLTPEALQAILPAGAARNALDCALWDLAAKRAGRRVWELAGLPAPAPAVTAMTLSLDEPDAMADAARAAAGFPLLKLKLGEGAADLARAQAVHAARPDAALILDGNEALSAEAFKALCAKARSLNVDMIEQPFPAGQDADLAKLAAPVSICADEGARTRADLEGLAARYDAVNIKLDKTGGFTEAVEMARLARACGFRIMLGCMVATSLGMAPAMALAGLADWIDLDGALLLARDREPGLLADGAALHPPLPELWG
jgi:L-alanine-DL-glutamate epimerase-like enolase superfamily enzyme